MSQRSRPLISIIMPCLNSERHIRGSIDCVFMQTLGDFELIVVDNGSSDRTPVILGTIMDPRLVVLNQPERGVSRARNLGLQHARGEFIAFLDSDDTWDRSFLEKMHNSLATNPQAVLAYCGWQNVGLPGPRGEPFVPGNYENLDKATSLLEGCRWPIHACLTKRNAILNAGGFNTSLTIAEDYLLWLEVAVNNQIVRVPEVLVQYHHHDGEQATHNRTLSVIDTLRAKQLFLARHPQIAHQVGPKKIEALTWGVLINSGTALYWQGDLNSARPIFRLALLNGHGSLAAKLRMLPSLLPLPLHRAILAAKEKLTH